MTDEKNGIATPYIDIHSKGEYPSNMLSNFYPHKFKIDGVSCGSMEGFLQSLKYKNRLIARWVAGKSGKRAKRAGDRKSGWRQTQTLFWRGVKYERLSPELAELIERAYFEMFRQCPKFRGALAATCGYELVHTIGKSDPRDTILTEREFIDNLTDLRQKWL